VLAGANDGARGVTALPVPAGTGQDDPVARLADYLPARPGDAAELAADTPLERFLAWADHRGITLYPAQEEAVLEAMSGSHVIVNTPTGSGKSLIALAAHFWAVCEGRRSWYTAPIKALVSEKFFDLAGELGPGLVGMATGDAAVNRDAPVICATAEVLANLALREGARAQVDQVVMDEFHFYADPDRGWAWQIPLLELDRAQFLLMSATLGHTGRFEADLRRRTGRPVAVVRSATRPVPLDYSYARTPIHETIEALLAAGQAPIYVVHFTQKDAVARAQALTSTPVASRSERDRIADEIAGFRFSAGFGQALGRYVRAGIGVHHAGMLPRYRRLVERLTQAGLLKVICGTDTLGVGINVPIRTVLLTGLAKYDGTVSRLLSAREFHQMSGRAGRAGYDREGSVVVQAPEHVVVNERSLAKIADDPKKRRKLVRAQPPKGFVAWSEDTFNRLVAAPPEPLGSSFKVTHAMLLGVLDRPGDGCAALRHLLTDNHESRPAQRAHIRSAIAMYRSLLAAGALERLETPDQAGRRVRVTEHLQADFALNQPLGPFVLDVLPRLAPSEMWALDAVSIVEATLENPGPVLAAQLDRLRAETITRLKAEGVEYEQRMEILDKLTWPKPLGEELYDAFDAYRVRHPWAADFNVKPKSVVRDMFERALGFSEYVALYGLARSEGLLLRYLTDAYRGLVQSVPEDAKSDELVDITEWLGELVRQVDSSLLDEWEALTHPEQTLADLAQLSTEPAAATGPVPVAVTANTRAFTVMVRNEAFHHVELLARRDFAGLGDLDGAAGWDAARWESSSAAYFAEHDSIGIGADARSSELFHLQADGRRWDITQTLDDPDGNHDWVLRLEADLDGSDAVGEAVLTMTGFEQL
jgi:superfamily II RNA helicase